MKPFYAFAKGVTTCLMRLAGARVIGREHIPADDALLLVCNHVSFGDPPALTMVYPRQITYIAKEEFLRNPLTRMLFGALGAVFLNKGESDLGALRAAMNELKQGRAVAIFPEGHRNFDQNLTEFMPGAAYIAQKSQVRVLPLAVLNTGDYFRWWKRNQLVLVGEPLSPPPAGRVSRQQLDEFTAQCREQVAALLEQGKAQLAAEGRSMRQIPQKRRAAPEQK